jgi:flagellar biosynthesis protein FlhA
LTILAAMLTVMGLVPGLPMLPFFTLAAIVGMLSYSMHKHGGVPELAAASAPTGAPAAAGKKTAGKGTHAAGAGTSAEARANDPLENLLTLDTLQIELGYGLVSLADVAKGGDLLERVTGVRRNFAQDMGLLIPPIRLRDNLQLSTNEYRFLLKGNLIASGQLMPGQWLAMNATNSKIALKGVPTIEPVFQLPATWVSDGIGAPSLPRNFDAPGRAGSAGSSQTIEPGGGERTCARATDGWPGATRSAKPAGGGHLHP